jgi:hypothetical protein
MGPTAPQRSPPLGQVFTGSLRQKESVMCKNYNRIVESSYKNRQRTLHDESGAIGNSPNSVSLLRGPDLARKPSIGMSTEGEDEGQELKHCKE